MLDQGCAGEKLVEQELKIPWHGEVLEITISIGLAFFPGHGNTLQQAVDAADAALYKAKQQGRNCVVTAGTGEQIFRLIRPRRTAGHSGTARNPAAGKSFRQITDGKGGA